MAVSESLRVIRIFSFKNLRAYKYHPKPKLLFAKLPKSWHACSFFACFSAFLACFAPQMVHSCVSIMSSPSEIVFAAVLGSFRSSTHDSSATLGRAFSPDEAVAGTRATPYVSSMLLVRIRMINFILRLPVPAKFSLSVRCTWQASTGFRRVGESGGPALLHLSPYLILES